MLEAILLGLLKGTSEFLPISSSGHLALADILFDVHGKGRTFSTLLEAGTLVASVLVLRYRLFHTFLGSLRALTRPSTLRTSSSGQDALFVVLAIVPTLLVAFSLRPQVAAWEHSPLVLGLGFLVTSLLLMATQFTRPGTVEHPTAYVALLLGAVQGLAVLPGVSRIGATMAVLMLLGTSRGRAFELGVLVSIPAVTVDVLMGLPPVTPEALPAALLGAVCAGVAGVAAILALRRMVIAGWFPLFALWVFPLAIATLAMTGSWPA